MGLRGNTLAALQSFKTRNDEARRKLTALQQLPTDVDFGHYRSTLKNQAVVDEMEKAMKDFSAKKVDVSRQIKAIEAFEATAVKSAEDTKGVVTKELEDLKRTLENIQGARAFEDLTVVCYFSDWLTSREDLWRCLCQNNTLIDPLLGRGYGGSARDPREGREDGLQPQVDATGIQGMLSHHTQIDSDH